MAGSHLLGERTKRAGCLREIASRNMERWLVADTKLETGGTPIDKLDGPLSLDMRNSCLNVLGYDVATVE